MAALSQRALLVPDTDEPVAVGAAIQAASMITGAGAADIAEKWGTLEGPMVEPGSGMDGSLKRIRATRDALS
jgi:xylulokinase